MRFACRDSGCVRLSFSSSSNFRAMILTDHSLRDSTPPPENSCGRKSTFFDLKRRVPEHLRQQPPLRPHVTPFSNPMATGTNLIFRYYYLYLATELLGIKDSAECDRVSLFSSS